MSTVTMSNAKDYDVNKDQPDKVTCGEVGGLAIGDVVVVDTSRTATKLDVSTYSGDGSDIGICLSASSQGDAVLVAAQGTDLIGITLSEGDVLYAKGVGLVGNDFALDLTTGDDVIILGFYAESGSGPDVIFRFAVTHLGFEKS